MYISIKYLYGVVSRNDKIGKLKQVEVRQGAGGKKKQRRRMERHGGNGIKFKSQNKRKSRRRKENKLHKTLKAKDAKRKKQ